MTENHDVLDALIHGRVRPSIYAFSTSRIPGSLKVGDTYRPVRKRLAEWRVHYPDLVFELAEPASVTDDVYVRDHAVHSYLMIDCGRSRVGRAEFPDNTYFSNEFFQGATTEDVTAALVDVQRDHAGDGGRYSYLDAVDHLPVEHHYERDEADWCLRPNQEQVVEAFASAVASGRSHLLMYAVMRFGKTFTSLMAAKRMNSTAVLVVSAKADVLGEWKQTVERAGNFEGFVFLDAKALLRDADAIADVRAAGGCAVVFLTLQDLAGSKLKEHHEEVFSSEIDLVIVDETHFGARGDEYGKVLREAKQPGETTAVTERFADDRIAVETADEQLKQLKARVRLHLSGSPYRILMGSEFEPDDIISTVQFADIVRAQEQWDLEHPDGDEWDNPYFGFPEMVRFAFHPNQSSRDRLDALKRSGVRYSFAALLEPRSIKRDPNDKLHEKFVHEAEIRDLLRVIDGTQQDENVLGFLDHDRIKQGEMCQHVVMVLPYCASCDAMEALIEAHTDFKNLGDYEILNISGLEGKARYPKPADVQRAVTTAAEAGRKTLTLTVNRMLTGSTVKQWDTMIYLKDTASPQEYDQATFRLQSPYLRSLEDEKTGEVIKEDLKPQTLLVDFDPDRLFRMQEQRSLVSGAVADDDFGDLEGRLREDLRISPVVTVNANKLARVEPADILEAISEYSRSRSVSDEARDVPTDTGLFDDPEIRKIIERQAELGDRAGLTLQASEGEEHDLDIDDAELGPPPGDDDPDPGSGPTPSSGSDDVTSLEKRLQTYYQRILFFAMLSADQVRSLLDIIEVIEQGDNPRIASNLGLDVADLRRVHDAFDRFKRNRLDYKIQNVSLLARDPSLTPIERASRALAKVDRLSDSEIRTPPWFCEQVVASIPGDELRGLVERDEAILDVASKSGEFTHALYERLVGELGVEPAVARSALYAIPTSQVAYEFSRRFFEILEIDPDHVAAGFTSYDIMSEAGADGDAHVLLSAFSEGSGPVKFGAIVGNPPYQESDGGAQASARPIYQRIIAAADALEPEFTSFVIPTRWYLGGRAELDGFRADMLADPTIREVHDYPNPKEVFPDTNNRGGVCFFLRDAGYDADAAGGTLVVTRDRSTIAAKVVRPLNTLGLGIFLRDSKGVDIVQKVIGSDGFTSFEEQVSARKPFGLDGKVVKGEYFHLTPDGMTDPVRCFGKAKADGFVERDLVRAHPEWVDAWKVLAPYANNIATELSDDNLNAFVVEPGSVCTESLIMMGIGLDLNEQSAANLVVYLRTRFARFLLAKAKISQHATKTTYRFVPTVDVSASSEVDWNGPIEAVDDHLFERYGLTDGEQEHIRSSIKPM